MLMYRQPFPSLCVDGVMHYIALDNDSAEWLMAFDVWSESFHMGSDSNGKFRLP